MARGAALRTPQTLASGPELCETQSLRRMSLEGRTIMARYIMLVNWTDQGIRNVKDSPKRLDAARNAAKGVGAEIRDFYMTMGDHDIVLVVDAPTDEAMAKLALIQGSAGNVRTKTLKAFSETEYRAIVGSLA
jgi:uncharacterized protein with GYD domain